MPPAQTAANANASGISPRDLIGQTVVHIMQILQLLTAMVNGLSPDVTTPRTLRLSIAGATEHFAALTRQLDEHDARAIAVRLGQHDRRRRSAAAAAARRRRVWAALSDDDDNDPPDDDGDTVHEYAQIGGGRGPPPPPGGGGACNRTVVLRRVLDGSVQRTIEK
jgi:hypothetical protein